MRKKGEKKWRGTLTRGLKVSGTEDSGEKEGRGTLTRGLKVSGTGDSG